MYDYRGTTTLVTGASRGIGRACARDLARRGSNLVLVARSAPALDRLAGEIRAEHRVDTLVLGADLADPAGPGTVADALRERHVSVDLLVNNAGTGSIGPFFGRPFEQSLRSVDVNVTGLMRMTRLIGADMLERGSGGIINVGSTAAFQPMPYQASYSATKAFVLYFTEALAHELRGTGVRVMGAHPGATETGFFDSTTAVMDPRVTDSPESVAARTLDDFARGRAASYPGRALHRWTTWAPRLLPRTAVTRAVAAVNRKAGFHDVQDVMSGPAS
ncbi:MULTISPECIES: SDR family NAD(P)-dependent oxidoreductase [unclassified Streptomyces]|uniref:SDR family NAD(P)-dependent oxidoreductase n=1 Tax=unclassified Streptomyces TaxID=2593676 RepID=UPI002E2B282C|nr:SDR family oxidoreductase [Streptomyces sp. NBC_01429]